MPLVHTYMYRGELERVGCVYISTDVETFLSFFLLVACAIPLHMLCLCKN